MKQGESHHLGFGDTPTSSPEHFLTNQLLEITSNQRTSFQAAFPLAEQIAKKVHRRAAMAMAMAMATPANTPLPAAQDGSTTSLAMSGSCESHDGAASRGVSIPHLSFATDLLFNLEDVKLHCTQGLASQNQLVTMLRSRVALEKHYANELMRMAQQSQLEELERGTTREALGKLKAQYLNTSVQHRVLAESLEEDVLKPIEELHASNAQTARRLHKTLNNVKKQAKSHEDVYKKDFGAFEKQFRDAAATFAAAMDAGFSSTAIDLQYHQQLMQLQTEEDPQYTADAPPAKHKSTVALQSSFNNNSQKLVNWLLASDQHRKDNLCSSAANALEATEILRRKCRKSWQVVEQSRIDMYRALQSVMTEYQHIAELRISNLATNLRKHVIFESSALANEQYDWQMIASKIESVDCEGDIRDYILMHHHLHDLPSMTVSDLWYSPLATSILPSPTSKPCHPLKRVPIEIGDVAMRRIPLDYEGNQASVAQILVTRASSVKIHPVSLAHEHPAPVAASSVETARFDQLRVDCSAPPATRRSLAELQEEAKSSLRVALAQDVAIAIAKASEHQATSSPHPQPRRSAPGARRRPSSPFEHSEPEDNGLDSVTAIEYPSLKAFGASPAVVQTNDDDDDDDDLPCDV